MGDTIVITVTRTVPRRQVRRLVAEAVRSKDYSPHTQRYVAWARKTGHHIPASSVIVAYLEQLEDQGYKEHELGEIERSIHSDLGINDPMYSSYGR